MKNTVFAVEEKLWNHYSIKMVIAKDERDAREIAKYRFLMVAPKATRLGKNK